MISNFILTLAHFLQIKVFSADTKVTAVSLAPLEAALNPPDEEQQ